MTDNPLPAKARRMVLKAMASHRDKLIAIRDMATDEDKIAELDMDISYAAFVIQSIKEWDEKQRP